MLIEPSNRKNGRIVEIEDSKDRKIVHSSNMTDSIILLCLAIISKERLVLRQRFWNRTNTCMMRISQAISTIMKERCRKLCKKNNKTHQLSIIIAERRKWILTAHNRGWRSGPFCIILNQSFRYHPYGPCIHRTHVNRGVGMMIVSLMVALSILHRALDITVLGHEDV